MISRSAVITGVGMVSPLGQNALSTAAAVRAGIAAFRDYEDFMCEPPEGSDDRVPLSGAPLHEGPSTAASLVDAFAQALQDLVKGARLSRSDLANTPLFAALPGDVERARNHELARSFLRDLPLRIGAPFGVGSALFPRENASVFFAIDYALKAMAEHGLASAIVGGVDSHFDSETLEKLDREGRLKTARNPDGFLPGASAVALLLETREHAARREARVFAEVLDPKFATEAHPRASREPSTAQGLSEAIRATLGSDSAPVSWVICDLNGERYRADEWGRTRVRMAPVFGGLRDLWHPADCLGDVGAATGGMLVGLGAVAFAKGIAPSDRTVLFTGSEDGTRAALVMRGV